MRRIERLKRRASYPIELPPNMEKSVAPDDQMIASPYQYSPGVGSMSYSPYTSLVENDAAERYEIVEKMLYFQSKKLNFSSDEPAPVAKDRVLNTIFDARASDIPTFGRCLKENRHLVKTTLSENSELN